MKLFCQSAKVLIFLCFIHDIRTKSVEFSASEKLWRDYKVSLRKSYAPEEELNK
jgi:hypothetical protein